jgi:hypothetical protein
VSHLSPDYARMTPQRHREPPPEVFIGEWLHALGVRPRDVARGAHLNEGYLSQLISGQKIKPSTLTVKKIGDFLGMDWRDLYRRPPSAEVIKEAATLDPAILARLRQRK